MTNVIDFRPNELETVHTEKTVHRLEITHKKSGVRATGTGINRYALECELLQILRDKMAQHELDKQSEGIACLK